MADNADRAAEHADVLDAARVLHRPRLMQRTVRGTDCMACGQDIAPERLAVLPNACLCIDCQEDAERAMER